MSDDPTGSSSLSDRDPAASPGPSSPTGAGNAAPDEALEARSWPPAVPPARRPAAHRRPGAVAFYFGYRAVAALLLATPVSVLAASFLRGQPRGDAVLFDTGGMMLIEVARVARAAAVPVAAQLGLGALLVTALGLIPLAALIVALGRKAPLSLPLVAGRVAQSIGTLALLWGVAWVAEVVAAVLVVLPGAKLLTRWRLGPGTDELAQVGVVLVAVLVAGVIGIVHDLARVAAVDEPCGFYNAASRAMLAVRRAPLATGWAFAWRGALALVAVVALAWITLRLGVSTAPRIALAFGLQYAALALVAFLRASWLAAAIRLLDRAKSKAK